MTGAAILLLLHGRAPAAERRPNILIAISDDQSFAHTSAAGFKAVQTPAFDRVAREGIWFRNAFAASPGCSPCRASLLTGRHTWQIEQAGIHASSFPTNYVVFPDLLEEAGYFVGCTGKGWGPGDWKVSGRPRNPAGPAFSRRKLTPPFKGINNNDYAGNFADFFAQRPKDKPFYFWYGANEPHRDYEKGSGLKSGKKLEDVVVPTFLPDTSEVRSDILDYCDWTYPQRALRTPQFLYIRNFQPDRWPAGDPRILRDDGSLGPMHGAYCDIDGSPTLKFLVANCDDPAIAKYLQLAVTKRPAEELFDIAIDPGCLKNLAAEAAFARTKQELSRQLVDYLRQTGDPRVLGNGDIWETYPRYSPIRKFPPPEAIKP